MDFRDIAVTSSFATNGLRRPLEALSSFGPTLNEATFGLLGSSFQPERDLPSLEGQTILVTGGMHTVHRDATHFVILTDLPLLQATPASAKQPSSSSPNAALRAST